MKLVIDKKQTTKMTFPIFTIAIVFMVIGFVVDNGLIGTDLEQYRNVGSVLFSVGFWLFFIPIIILLVILGVILIIVVLGS